MKGKNKMRVLVVDDDKLICASLKMILESNKDIQVVATANSGEQAIDLYKKFKPDILLMDIRMDKMSGLEAGENILNNYKDAKILYLTTFADDEYIIKAFKIGAHGYILKQDFESIIPSIRAVHMGQYVFGRDIVSKIPLLISGEEKKNFLKLGINDKELEIISLVADGLNNKEISENLFLSEGTVRNYISAILEKLELRDRTQLAVFYFKNK